MKLLFAILYLSLSLGLLANTNTGDLIVVVDNIKEKKGEVVLALFNSETDFLKKGVKSIKVKVSEDGRVRAVFSDIPKGNYSISVFHDVNENGELDKNIVGIPKEGFGFSNNKMGVFGPPSYQDCLVELADDKKEVVIELRQL